MVPHPFVLPPLMSGKLLLETPLLCTSNLVAHATTAHQPAECLIEQSYLHKLHFVSTFVSLDLDLQ